MSNTIRFIVVKFAAKIGFFAKKNKIVTFAF